MRVARFLLAVVLASVLGWLSAACAPAATTPAPPAASVAPTTATAPERQPPAAVAPPTAPPPAPAAPPPLQPLKFADVPSIALAPLYIASERGHFAAEGLSVELEPLAGGADAVALLGTGQIDANAGAVSAGTFNAVQRGVDIRIVAPMSFLPQSGGATPLLIRKDLAEQARSPAEMKGRRVAINVRGGANEYLLTKALAQGGLALDDVDLVLMPFPDVPQALAQGAVDFALPAEPFATRALEAGGATMFLENVAPGLMNTVVFFSARLRSEQPRAAQGFVLGLMRAARDLQGAAAKSDEHVRILAQYTRLSPDVLRASAFNAWDPDLRIQAEDLLDQQRVHIQNGRTEFTEPLPLDRLVDERFQAAALQTLGPAPR